MSNSMSFQALVQSFFVQHLAIERSASPNTIAAYRDAMKLFFRHCTEATGCSPDELGEEVLDGQRIRAFLGWLEHERQSSPRTRNQRLAALKSFARYVASVAPEHLERCRLIREIPPARAHRPQIGYLSDEELVQLIAGIDGTTATGRRDRALFLLLYNTGARVQEVVNLSVADFAADTIPFVRIIGKGGKVRTTPLWPRTTKALRRMLADRGVNEPGDPLFLNARGRRISRSGIAYVLRRAQRSANVEPRHAARLTPHVMRHTTAMHLLQSGVDITTIAAWLGHAQLSTTHAYIEIDLRMKQAAIAAASALPDVPDVAYPKPDIIDWLDELCSHDRNYVKREPRQVPTRAQHARFRSQLHITGRGG